MVKQNKRPKAEKSPLETVPTRKLMAMIKQDIRQVLKATASAAKPKKK